MGPALSNTEVVIFGASGGGIIAHDLYRKRHNIVAFSDNDPNKWGSTLNGLPIIRPNQIKQSQQVIVASQYLPQILPDLENLGLEILWPESMEFSRHVEKFIDRSLTHYLNTTENPILIYQMGKVGSVSIENILRANKVDYFSAHKLNDQAARSIQEVTHNKPVRIITLVREAIARDISALFHFFPDTIDSNRALFEVVCDSDIGSVMTSVLRHSPNSAVNWLTDEFEKTLDVDIYAHPFDPDEGYTNILHGNMNILVVRLESIDHCLTALSNFLGINVEYIPHDNKGSRKWYACLYDEFLNNFNPSPEYLDAIYRSRYMQHFYSATEIAEFRAKWEAGA